MRLFWFLFGLRIHGRYFCIILHKICLVVLWQSGVMIIEHEHFIQLHFIGLTLAAPIGPVNSTRLNKRIKNGFWHAWIVGGRFYDCRWIFMLVVYLGMVHFLDFPFIQILLWLFGGFILMYSGLKVS